VTPTSYLQLISTYKQLLGAKRAQVAQLKRRYEVGSWLPGPGVLPWEPAAPPLRLAPHAPTQRSQCVGGVSSRGKAGQVGLGGRGWSWLPGGLV
jgi:hypothetical protein